MSEYELHRLWASARWHIIASQVAPTILLATAVGLVMAGLGHQPTPIRLGAALILLASGLLGFAAQFSAASELKAIAADLKTLGANSAVSRRVIESATRSGIVTTVAPAIFVLIYLALLWAIFAPPSLGGMQ